MSHHKARSFKKRKAFLDALELSDSPSMAARKAGEDLSFFKRWAKDDADFKRDWEEAEEAGTDFLEDVATDRAIRKSDPLMLAALKARRPHKWDRAKQIELSGGISVEGAKGKLLNKLAKLRAEDEKERQRQKALEKGQEEERQEAQEGQKLLPPPGQPFEPGEPIVRGSKRRRQDQSGGRENASA